MPAPYLALHLLAIAALVAGTAAMCRRDRRWSARQTHAVVFFGVEIDRDASGTPYEVAVIGDPTYGVERWVLDHFDALWDGTAVEVD